MTLTVFRLGKHAHRAQLFNGQGGLYASGRWTPRGRPIVYTSANISLAVLEYTVNYRRRGWVPATVLGRATIPASVRVQTVSTEDLPANWFAADPPPQLQRIGGEWLERGETAVLKVPSAIVIEECNYLLNPLHADFGKLRLGAPKLFSFDRRVGDRERSRQGVSGANGSFGSRPTARVGCGPTVYHRLRAARRRVIAGGCVVD